MKKANPSRKHRYFLWFKRLVDAGIITRNVAEKTISHAIQDFQRSDRVEYVLRLKRLRLVNGFLVDSLNRLFGTTKVTAEEAREMLENFWKGYPSGTLEYLMRLRDHDEKWLGVERGHPVGEYLNTLLHYYGEAEANGYPTALGLIWKRMSPHELCRKMEEASAKDAETILRHGIFRKGTTLIDLGNGYKWVMLDRGYCELEGQAMRHCGNQAIQSPGNVRILSLRETVKVNGKDSEKVHLTFIWHGIMPWATLQMGRDYISTMFHPYAIGGKGSVWKEDEIKWWGFLSEMKGYANTKPSSFYHPFIVKLLLHPIIQGIVPSERVSGYLSENDFKLSDLPKEIQERLMKEKPSLFDMGNLSLMFPKKDWEILLGGLLLTILQDTHPFDPTLHLQPIFEKEGRLIIGRFVGMDAAIEDLPGLPRKVREDWKAYAAYLNGSEHLEFFTTLRDTPIEELLEMLAKEDPALYKKLIARAKADGFDENEESLDEWLKLEEPDYAFSFAHAFADGLRSGTEGLIYKKLKSAIENAYEAFFVHFEKDGSVVMGVEYKHLPHLISSYQKEDEGSDTWWGLDVGPIGEIGEDYDEEAALQSLMDLLPDTLK